MITIRKCAKCGEEFPDESMFGQRCCESCQIKSGQNTCWKQRSGKESK